MLFNSSFIVFSSIIDICFFSSFLLFSSLITSVLFSFSLLLISIISLLMSIFSFIFVLFILSLELSGIFLLFSFLDLFKSSCSLLFSENIFNIALKLIISYNHT